MKGIIFFLVLIASLPLSAQNEQLYYSLLKPAIDSPPGVQGCPKFGILGFQLSTDTKIAVAGILGVNYQRGNTNVNTYSGNLQDMNEYDMIGMKTVLNVNFADQSSGAGTFATDTTAYKLLVDNVLDDYSPEVCVIENEPTNDGYYNFFATNMVIYLNELRAATTVVHQHGLLVADGGIHPQGINYWIWRDYIDRGETDSAADWRALTFTGGMNAGVNNPLNPINTYWRRIDTLLNGYTSIPIDFVNVHFYEPHPDLGDDVVTIPGMLETIARYLRTRTGKQVMSNEWGMDNTTGPLATSIMAALQAGDYKYALYFDGNDNPGGPYYLHDNPSLILRPNGQAFKDYIINHNCNDPLP